MKTKEAIEKLKHIMDCYKCIGDERINNIERDKIDIVDLLKRGEKYEAMWEEVVRYFSYMEWKDEIIEKIKQKYFPKDNIKNEKINAPKIGR